MKIKIVQHDKTPQPGKLADAELHFTCSPNPDLAIIENVLRQLYEDRGKLYEPRIEAARAAVSRAQERPQALDGLKLIGFSIWERRAGGGRNVTFPARQYSVNGERRTFALLRPVTGDAASQDKIRDLVLQAYAEYESDQLQSK